METVKCLYSDIQMTWHLKHLVTSSTSIKVIQVQVVNICESLNKMFKLIVLCVLMSSVPTTAVHRLHFQVELKNVKKLSRFWTNTGFCPPAPTDNSSTLAEFFLSEKVTRNLDYVSALPNNGLKSVRIHWLINLIEFVWAAFEFVGISCLIRRNLFLVLF